MKWRFGRLRGQLVEHGLDHRGRDLLGGQAVAAAEDPGHRCERGGIAIHRFHERRHHLEIQRLADRARLLGPVEDRDGPHGRWQGRDHLGGRERVEKPDAQHPDLFAGRHQRVDRFLDRARGGAHDHDHPLGIGGAVVVDQVIRPTCPGRELIEHRLDDARDGEVIRVRRLARLEEHVRVLRGPAHDRGLGRESAPAMREDILLADERAQVVAFQQRDPVDLMRCPEAVEEVQERDPRSQRGRMGDQREIVRLLHRTCREHRPTGRPGMHHVAVVAEDRQRVGGDRAGRHMHDGRRQLAGDLEHVGDHQQEALGGREGRGERALLEGTVHRAGRATLGLHLDDVGDGTPQVRRPGRRPIVAMLGHLGGRSDRVDRDDFAQRIGDARRRLVAVERFEPMGSGRRPGGRHGRVHTVTLRRVRVPR